MSIHTLQVHKCTANSEKQHTKKSGIIKHKLKTRAKEKHESCERKILQSEDRALKFGCVTNTKPAANTLIMLAYKHAKLMQSKNTESSQNRRSF